MRFVKVILVLLFALYPALMLAQGADQPISVPVKFKVSGGNGAVTATLNSAVSSRGSTSASTPIATTVLEIGKPYNLVISAANTSSKTGYITPPPGYQLLVDGMAKSAVSFKTTISTYTVRVVPPEDAVAELAGTASSIEGGQIKWSVALGSLLNGESAGHLRVSGAATTDWSPFYTPSTAYYESDLWSQEIYVHRVNGNIRQISVKEAFVDVVVLNSTSYELRFYNPDSATGSTYPKPITGLPFVTYRIAQDGGSTKLRITKETRTLLSATDTTAPIARTEWTTIERTGTSPAFTWTVAGWTLAGQSPLSREVRTWTGNASGGHDETIQILGPDNVVVSQASRVHTHFAWGDTPTTTTLGTVGSVTESKTYNTNQAAVASYGFVDTIQSTGGAWTAYDYFPETDDRNLGIISAIYSPFLNSPATVTKSANAGIVTSMTYVADPSGSFRRPASTEVRVNGIVTAKTLTYYGDGEMFADGDRPLVTVIRYDHANPEDSLANFPLKRMLYSSFVKYSEGEYDPFFRNQIHKTYRPDTTTEAFVRQRGTWDGISFTPNHTPTFLDYNTGPASRIGVISGLTGDTPGAQMIYGYDGYSIEITYIIPGKSTIDFVIRDNFARVVRTESCVWDGTTWQLIKWTNFNYNLNNQLITRVASNGDTYEAGYSGELKLWERDGTGVKIAYTYDHAGRVKTTTKEGANGLPDLISENTYDAAGRVVKQEAYAASGSEERITSSRTYDLAGRLETQTPPGVGATTYSYDPINRTQTVTDPSLATRIQTAYLDGQPYSVTGTGGVAQYFTYGVESDGRRWSQVNLATANSPRWSKNWTDWLGRFEHSERPGFTGQPNYVEKATYHASTGQLLKTERSGMADILYTYNAFGQPVLSGLDINGNGSLDLASADRISGQEQWFANEGAAWWLATRSYTYATLNSATETTIGSTRERLTGFTGNLRSESRVTDVEGNTATSMVSVDRTARTIIKTTQAPGLSSPSVETIINGLGTTTTTPDGLTFTTGYDVLQRAATSTNVRAGVARTLTVTYEPDTERPLAVIDPAGTTTATYGYDIMGRQSWVKNAENNYTRFEYTPRGELSRQWGAATTPVSFDYNSYGERTTLTTYRTDGVWDGTTWPSSPPSGDTTTWTFDGPSGLLQKKIDASARYVEYDYNVLGQVSHRYWSRTLDGTANTARITATYGYASQTGEPLSVTYNDGTPSVATTYTRMGQAATVSDYTGTRAFNYDSTSPWRHHTTTLPAFYNGCIFKNLYETTTSNSGGTVKGRGRGFQLGSTSIPAALLEQTYTVSALGRLTGITSARTNAASSQTFAYGYLSGSQLLETTAATGTAFAITRSYEPQRDLLTSIKAEWSTATKSEFTYTHDIFGRRETVVQSGDAFLDYGDITRQKFVYSDRGELTDAKGYLGAEDPANQLPGRQFQFGYDAAGNRASANHTGDPAKIDEFTINEINQLTERENKAISVSGIAAADTAVAVDGQPASRQGRFWQADILQSESIAAMARSLATVASKPGGGTGGADLSQIDRRFVWLPDYRETLTYDADGNLTSDAKWIYAWDAENRLSAMEGKAWTAVANGHPRQRLEFRYDSIGRRVLKRVLAEAVSPGTWVLVTETRFLYDSWNLIAEFTLIAPLSTPNLVRSYTWGLDLAGSMSAAGGVGGLLQITDYTTGENYFPTYDGNGNVTTLVSAATGALVASYEYSVFGEALRATGSYAKTNPFRFSSKFTDNETGLIYYGFRYYSPSTGRFLGRDPIGEKGGVNLYGFVNNDAVNNCDFLGLEDYDRNGIDDEKEDGNAPPVVLEPVSVTAGDRNYVDPDYYSYKLFTPSPITAGGLYATSQGLFRAVNFAGYLPDGSEAWDVVWLHDELRQQLSRQVEANSKVLLDGVMQQLSQQAGADIKVLLDAALHSGEIRAYSDPGAGWGLAGGAAFLRGLGNTIKGYGSMIAHPIDTYRSFRTIREPLTPYGSKLDNLLLDAKMKLQSPYGRGSLMGDAVVMRGMSLAGPTVGGFRAGLAAEGTSSQIVLGGGLMASENAGGHLLARHVGQTEAQLMSRALTDPSTRGVASAFFDRATAEMAASQVIGANAGKIGTWLGGGGGRLTIEGVLGTNVGRVVTSEGVVVMSSSSRFVLVRSASSPNGYYILTGFPF